MSFPPGRWRASWIWAGGATGGRHAVALRREFAIDGVPAVVPARMSAISRFALQVNGVEVARGPVRADPRRQPYDDIDLAPHLRAGGNTLDVLAWRYDGPTPWWLPPSPLANDLGQGAFVFEARLGTDWLVSDERWQGAVLDGWGAMAGDRISGRGRELIDLRSPATWSAAITRRAVSTGEPGRSQPPSFPGGPFGPRPIGRPDPVDLALDPVPGGFVADRIVSGTLLVDASGPAGSTVVVRVAEFLDAAGAPAPGEHDASVAVTLDGSRRTAETLDLFGLRGATVEPAGGAVVHGVAVRQRTYPLTGGAAFACSDERLDTIWQVGRRTVTLCSADAYVDCPTREQRAWAGDSVVHQLVDLTTNTDWRLARWNVHLVAAPRSDGMLPMAAACDADAADFTIIPDWALHWVHALWNLHRYVGDREEIASLLPVAERVVRWFTTFVDGSGLPTDVIGWVIIDWASVYTEGVCAALCGLWGRALLEFAEMAEWLGDLGRARWARATHERLAAGFERLWDPARGRYGDSTVRQPMASQHGQAAAIVGGLAPRERWGRLVEVLTDTDRFVDAAFSASGPATVESSTPVGGDFLRTGHPEPWWDVDKGVVRAQPFFRYVVHDALVAAGRADLIATQCLDWTAALDRCATSWTETWYGGTVSHGWSSTPTRDLMTRVLGVEPAEPGFGVARIEPALGGLEWARGAVPCPAGLIEVHVTAEVLEVDSPIPFEHGGRRYAAGRHTL